MPGSATSWRAPGAWHEVRRFLDLVHLSDFADRSVRMFAFLASMDNYPISIFFTDAWTKTLPIQMLQYVEERPDPTIAAISAGLVLLAIVALIIGDRLVGLRKLADF